jgi:hypothetical protein
MWWSSKVIMPPGGRRGAPLGAGTDSVGVLLLIMVHVPPTYVKEYMKIRTYAE